MKRTYAALVPALLLSLSLGACSDSSGGSGGGQPVDFQAVIVSFNDGSGMVQGFDANLSSLGTFTAGGNEGIAAAGTCLVQADDSSSPSRFVLIDGVTGRLNNGSFDADRDDDTVISSAGNAKGLTFIARLNLVLTTVNNGRAAAGQIDAFSLAGVRGTTGAPQDPVFSLAPYSGGNIAAGSPVTATSPWDLEYDEVNDRLFVALMDGFVAVYDNFRMTSPAGRNADRFFRPTEANGTNPAINLHGIIVLDDSAAGNTLVLTDVGSAADATDGRIFVLRNPGQLSGDVDARGVIGGPSTMLGNPVDIAGRLDNVFVVEKSNNLLMRFDNIVDGPFGDRPANAQVTIPAADGVLLIEGFDRNLVDHQDLDEPTTDKFVTAGTDIVRDGFVVVQNPGGTGDAAEGDLVFLPANLSGSSLLADINLSNENLTMDSAGTLYVSSSLAGDGSETAGTGAILTIGGRFGMGRTQTATSDAIDDTSGITGASTGLFNPKGLELVQSRGLIIVGDIGDGTVRVFPQKLRGNVSPIFTIDAGGNPWDLDYDVGSDTLFCALTNGTVSVFSSFLARGAAITTPDRVITPMYPIGGVLTAAINLHGIAYLSTQDRLVLTDVGSAADGTDGALMGIDNASAANGPTATTFVYRGANTMLGNPVDIVVDRFRATVCEKSNNLIMSFDVTPGVVGELNLAPAQSVSVTAPEAIILVQGIDLTLPTTMTWQVR